MTQKKKYARPLLRAFNYGLAEQIADGVVMVPGSDGDKDPLTKEEESGLDVEGDENLVRVNYNVWNNAWQ